MLLILVSALAGCNLPQPGSPGAGGSGSATNTPNPLITPTTGGDAGGATLNLRRDASYEYSTGSDVQSEEGAIPLVFTKSTEGDLIVEGKGVTEWSEVTTFEGCSYTSKAEGEITVTGLFKEADCKFHLTINTKFSQPTTTYQDQNTDVCSGSVQFSQTEFSSQIELDPTNSRFTEKKEGSWWETTTITLTNLKSEVVDKCFAPEVITLD
jgi:hypothetical protein